MTRNVYKAVLNEYFSISMTMATFSFNATDFCSDSFIEPSFTTKPHNIVLSDNTIEPSFANNQLDIVWQFCTYLVAARLLTVFYLRTFTFKKHGGSLAADLALLLTLQTPSRIYTSYSGTAYPVVALLAIAGLVYTQRRYNKFLAEQGIKTIVTALALYTASTSSLPTLHTVSLLGAATQFVRSPAWLRDLLREPRLVCGPIHPIMVLATGRFMTRPLTTKHTMYLISIFCVTTAAGILRPDNTQVLKLLPASLSTPFNTLPRRRAAHGLLMFISVVLMMLNAFRLSGITQTQMEGLCVLFTVVVIMYSILKLWK